MSVAAVATVVTLRPALPDTPLSALPGLLIPAYGQTLLMVGIVMVIVVALGLPLGVLAYNAGPRGLFPNRRLSSVLSLVISLGRSLPFLVLMAAIIPFTLLITGTSNPAHLAENIVAGDLRLPPEALEALNCIASA